MTQPHVVRSTARKPARGDDEVVVGEQAIKPWKKSMKPIETVNL
jgi:hypothetical protein